VPKLCAIQATSKASQVSQGKRHMAPLELIRFDILEMNGVLTDVMVYDNDLE
jgi:hypothetical protein